MYIEYIMKTLPTNDDLVRTQIYLSARQQHRLEALARRASQSKSHLIRAAIDRMLDAEEQGADDANARRQRLQQLAGVWADKPAAELPDVRALRQGWRRRPAA